MTPDEGNLLFEMKAHQGRVLSVADPAKNPSIVASAGPETVVRVWDGIYDLAYSPDGLTLASGHGDGAIRIWQA